MNFKTFISLLIAVSFGLAAVWVGRDLILGSKAPAGVSGPSMQMTTVAAAKSDMDPGHVIDPAEDVMLVEVPVKSAPDKVFADLTGLKDRALMTAVVRGQVMFEGLLAPQGAEGGLTALVPKGMRAVSVEVTESSGVSGLLAPGCRVDVIATLRQENGQMARTIVENAKVQAVGPRLQRGRSDANEPAAKTVTLIVNTKDAEAIELASNFGRPRLVLRGPSDTDRTSSAGVTSAELSGIIAPAVEPVERPTPGAPVAQGTTPARSEPSKVAPPAPVRWPVQIIRGNNESTIYYEISPKSQGTADGGDPSLAAYPPPAERQPDQPGSTNVR